MNNNPFVHDYFIGYINQVMPQYVSVHFPSSILLKTFTLKGEQLNGGLVGNFVVIEGQKFGFLGKILELSLPEKERLNLSEQSFQNKEFHPTGKIEILLSFDLFEPSKIDKGLNSLPTIGAKVLVCTSEFIKGYFKGFGVKEEHKGKAPLISLGCLTYDKTAKVQISQQAIFGRHCAVVGTTGGGKSYTISKLLEGLIANNSKAILIDATGEYNGKYNGVKSIDIGDGKHVFHYSQLSIDDLFYLFRPSSKTQVPKLMEAIRSLKIVSLNNGATIEKTIKVAGKQDEIVKTKIENGLLKKSGSDKRPFEEFYFRNIAKIEDDTSSFIIEKLTYQLTEECIWDTATEGAGNNRRTVTEKWGGRNDADISYCISLISRINNIINSSLYQSIFGFKQKLNSNDITKAIEAFFSSNDSLLRLNFGDIPFEFQVREILANAIGKHLLTKARNHDFKKKPIVLIMDEAHQFLNKTVKDEYFDAKPLDAFESIAKECRKHGLFLCLATQMPRDIPAGTLSQMGTFIVHRLINHFDKDAISNASSSASKNSLDFLPVLGAGEAILMGVDFPMPLMLKIDKPEIVPDSETPIF